jgi:hypothetical protein
MRPRVHTGVHNNTDCPVSRSLHFSACPRQHDLLLNLDLHPTLSISGLRVCVCVCVCMCVCNCVKVESLTLPEWENTVGVVTMRPSHYRGEQEYHAKAHTHTHTHTYTYTHTHKHTHTLPPHIFPPPPPDTPLLPLPIFFLKGRPTTPWIRQVISGVDLMR